MDKERSKSSLQIANPHCQRAFPEQKHSVTPEVISINENRSDMIIKASDLKESESAILQSRVQKSFKNENPEYQSNYHSDSSDPKKSLETNKMNLASPQIQQSSEHRKIQDEAVNFEELFAFKKKYESLVKINNSFLSIIESGKISISPQKQSVGYRKDKFMTQPNLEELCTQEQEKMKIIALKKQQMLQQLNKLYAEQTQVRTKKKALILAVKANHQSTKLLKSSRIKAESPIKRLKTQSKEQISPQRLSFSHQNKSFTKPSKDQCVKVQILGPEQQKKSITRILKEKAEKQLYFLQKEKQILQKAEKQKQQALEQQKQKIEEGRQRRRSKAIQKLQKSKHQRESKNRNHPRSYTSLKTEPAQGLTSNEFFTQIQSRSEKKDQSLPKSLPKMYIYKKIEIQSAQKDKQRLKYEQTILTKRRQETKVDFEQIRVHLQKYKQIKMEKIELQKQKIQSMRNQQKQRLKKIRQKYGFLTKIKQNMLEEERKSIQLMESHLITKANYHKKMRDYFVTVKQKTQTKQTKRNNLNRVKTSISVENEETNNQYSLQASRNLTIFKHSRMEMNKTKNNTQLMSRKKASSFLNSRTDDQVEKEKRYKNYLDEMRKNSNSKASFDRKQQTMMDILKNENSSLEQIQKAFGIFKDLNKSFWQGHSQKQKKVIRRQGHLFSNHKNEEQHS